MPAAVCRVCLVDPCACHRFVAAIKVATAAHKPGGPDTQSVTALLSSAPLLLACDASCLDFWKASAASAEHLQVGGWLGGCNGWAGGSSRSTSRSSSSSGPHSKCSSKFALHLAVHHISVVLQRSWTTQNTQTERKRRCHLRCACRPACTLVVVLSAVMTGKSMKG